MTWFNVMQCVTAELFPMMTAQISQCVQEKLLKDNNFKMSDISEEAANDIIELLKEKRTMNYKEVMYLKGLMQRARDFQPDAADQGL